MTNQQPTITTIKFTTMNALRKSLCFICCLAAVIWTLVNLTSCTARRIQYEPVARAYIVNLRTHQKARWVTGQSHQTGDVLKLDGQRWRIESIAPYTPYN